MLKDIRKLTIALLSTAALGIATGSTVVSAAPAASPMDRVNAAFSATGMTDAKQSRGQVVGLIVKGSMQAFDPGEAESVSDPYKPDWGISTFTQTWDGSRGLTRIDYDRPRANGQQAGLHRNLQR